MKKKSNKQESREVVRVFGVSNSDCGELPDPIPTCPHPRVNKVQPRRLIRLDFFFLVPHNATHYANIARA